jgi:uncharacterized Zn finger protein
MSDTIAKRVAFLFIKNASDSLESLPFLVEELHIYVSALVNIGIALEDLIDFSEARRLQRVDHSDILDLEHDLTKVQAVVKGLTSEYRTRINFEKRGHQCTCPDWKQRGKSVGPCKHVLALGLYYKENILVPESLKLETRLRALLKA